MVSAPFAAFAALSVPLVAIEFFSSLVDLKSVPSSSMTTHQDPALGPDAVGLFPFQFQVVLLLAATVALFAAVALIHLHLRATAANAAGAGNNNMRLSSELLTFIVCATSGTLEFFLFALPGAVVHDLGALVGTAAFEALPASATLVFLLGIALVIRHIRAGGEGGGGGDGVGNPRHVVVALSVHDDVLKKVALVAAGALLGQIAISAIYVK